MTNRENLSQPNASPSVNAPIKQVRTPETAHKYKFALVACARWEEVYIQEWIEYHKSIGFEHIYLYSNDDDPTLFSKAVAPYALGTNPFVTFQHWPVVGQQPEIYFHFLANYKSETEWFAFLDIDEFFVIKDLNNIAEFMLEFEQHVDCLYFNWVIYGHNGRPRRDDSWVLTSYTRRSAGPDAATKMLCRSDSIDLAAIEGGWKTGNAAFWHFLDNYHDLKIRCVNVLHTSMEGYSADFPSSGFSFVRQDGFPNAILAKAYVAHFQFKSEQDFLRRWKRGGFDNGGYWRELYESGRYHGLLANINVAYDPYLAAYWFNYIKPTMKFGGDSEMVQPFENVALHKPSLQSSIFSTDMPGPPLSRVAGGANNGLRTGTYGFHTQSEPNPWWMVDLLAVHRIFSIQIYNRLCNPVVAARANELDVLVSSDRENWVTLFSYDKQEPFGLDGAPLTVQVEDELYCRYVMLRLRTAGCLHLDEVAVYGALTK